MLVTGTELAKPGFLQTWGSLIVAAVALVQPWVMRLWRRQRGTIEILPSGNLEIGYSTFGPTVGVLGALVATHRERFVSNVTLRIIREKDQAQYNFQWMAFRASTLVAGKPAETTFELPAGFVLTPLQSQRFNIFFNDANFEREIKPAADQLAADWATVCYEYSGRANVPPDDPQGFYLTVFVNKLPTPGIFAELERACYWEAGSYILTLTIHTIHPSRSIDKSWRFSLTRQDSERLRLNTLKIMEAKCLQSDGPWNFVAAAYEPVTVNR